MATAQSFGQATPAPDPGINPWAAGLAGALQGGASQLQLQQQMAIAQQVRQQEALKTILPYMAQQNQLKIDPTGNGQLDFGGQSWNVDPNGMGWAQKKDASDIDLNAAKAKAYASLATERDDKDVNQGVNPAMTAFLANYKNNPPTTLDQMYQQSPMVQLATTGDADIPGTPGKPGGFMGWGKTSGTPETLYHTDSTGRIAKYVQDAKSGKFLDAQGNEFLPGKKKASSDNLDDKRARAVKMLNEAGKAVTAQSLQYVTDRMGD